MTASWRGRLGALHAPAYRRFWLGSLASVGATQLLFLGQAWLVFELSASTFDLGLLGASVSVPSISVILFGGMLADRLDRRRVIMSISLMLSSLLALLATLDASGVVRVWHVLTIAAVFSLLSGIDWPARQSIFPSLIDRRHMMSAVALNSILWQGTRMTIPALGGLLIAFGGTWTVFAISAAGFAAMWAVMASLKVAHTGTAGRGSIHSIIEGVRFIATQPLFAVLILLSWGLMFFCTSYVQLMPAFARLLGVEETGYGVLIAASGVGSVVGTLLVVPRQSSRRLGLIMMGGAIASGLSLLCFSAVTGLLGGAPFAYGLALVTVFAVHASNSFFLIASMTVLQLRVPDELRGRVMGVHGISFNLIALGGLFCGSLAAVTSPPAAVATGAVVFIVCATWAILSFPAIRNLDGRTHTTHAPAEGT